ncbi:GerAB/ArcD/ProY family transporter [Paenibacillus andongensis]|uniref:GerAB/ArcD/ProY family transporter n=1 Tax=Paenibacillus andongensis TaxID=2975482 RepID=UPI0021BA9C36|nr:spore germination protein [Paenibacillus andongensis]
MKLSGWQMICTIVTIEFVMAVWLRISPAIEISNQDAWLSIIIGGILAAAITFLVVRLSLLHPNQSLTVFSQKLLGKWLGRIIVLPYFTAWYILAGDVLRSFADFIHLILLNNTPVWIIMLLMTGLMTYMTYSTGITGIGRFCEIAGPITILVFIFSLILNVGNTEWHLMLPVYSDSGWRNIIKASYAPASFFGETFVLLVIVSFMQNPKKALSTSMLSVGITVFMVLTATIMVLLVFGPSVSAKLRFPYFMLVRSINIFNFVQNLDIFIVFIWVFGVFAKISFYLFITSYELANLSKTRNWRKMIWFSVPMIFIIALLIPNESTIVVLQELWRLIVIPVCAIGIPLLLWIVSMIKRRKPAAIS